VTPLNTDAGSEIQSVVGNKEDSDSASELSIKKKQKSSDSEELSDASDKAANVFNYIGKVIT